MRQEELRAQRKLKGSLSNLIIYVLEVLTLPLDLIFHKGNNSKELSNILKRL